MNCCPFDRYEILLLSRDSRAVAVRPSRVSIFGSLLQVGTKHQSDGWVKVVQKWSDVRAICIGYAHPTVNYILVQSTKTLEKVWLND